MAGRVVMFTPTPTGEGGAGKHTRTIAGGLADRGWEVTVIARGLGGRRPRRSRIGRVDVIELPGFGNRLGAVAFLLLAVPLGLLRGRRAVYVSLELASQGLVAATCATLSRRPYVGFSFSSGRRGEIEHFRASRLWPLRRALLRRARYLVGQTPAAAAELRAIVEEERIAVVPTPVEAVEAPPLSGEPKVLFTGRLTGQKGLDGLLDAWELVLARVPAARLTIAGSAGGGEGSLWPPVEEELKARVAASPPLRDSVAFTGWVADVSDLLAGHDVYVLPSRSEGMSNSLLEAGAWGRVIAASDLLANRAVLGEDYPLLFAVDDAEAMAERLVAALADEAARRDAIERIGARMPAFYADGVLDRIEALLS
ncbi:MAG TPA: glycosyltransferase family 4 protein [Solirubrobacterales bacterium]|nr:glycosyltransferase family 4 protein [Solirubrobacterales bacterium]